MKVRPLQSEFSALGQRTIDPPISWLMRMTLDQPGLISLAAGFTDNESLPVEELRRCLLRLLGSKRAQASLQYGSTNGEPRLRRLTADDLERRDAGLADAAAEAYAHDRLIITNGSQQLLYMVVEALCDPGDIILVEDPTYFVYLGIAQSHALRCRGVRMEKDGISLTHLDKVLSQLARNRQLARVKFLYLVSYFQNPSGTTTSFAKKAGALELLRTYERRAGHPIYLVEDAAYRDLRFAGEETPSALAAPGAAARVIYTGTYSKPFATGARVGFGLLPESIFSVAHRIKGNHDFGTANLLQQLLTEAMETGEYRRHLPVMRARYSRKATIMLEAMRRHFPASVGWDEPRGGLYVWARLPKRRRTGVKSKLFRAMLDKDVLYVPGALCYADDPTRSKPDSEMRLSFGGASERSIRLGIARMGEVLRRLAAP